MKQSKTYPFLKLQHQRFKFYFENKSRIHEIPKEQDFFKWIWHAFKNAYRSAEINLILLDKTEAQQYNKEFRNKDYATNVLSFAHNEGEIIFDQNIDILMGDLIMCPEVIINEALQQKKTISQHFSHLAIHGTLHLMGYDHINEQDAELMENREILLLNNLNYPNPYIED